MEKQKQELKLGVGICTRNRPVGLSRVLMKLLQYRNEGPLYYDLFVADDGSENEGQIHLLERLKDSEGVPVATNFGTEDSARLGVAKNKNRILRHFADCDYIVIWEDDAWPIHPDWFKVHIETSKATNIHHFNYVPHSMPQHVGRTYEVMPVTLPGGQVVHVAFTQYLTGVFLFYSHKVIEKLGGFDRRFGLYGFEHVEFSDRIRDSRIGLTPAGKGYTSLLECEKFLSWDIHEPSIMTKEEKDAILKGQSDIWAAVRKDSFLYRPF